MMRNRSLPVALIAVLTLFISTSLSTSCSSSGGYSTQTSVHYGGGYRSYHGRPWGGYGGYGGYGPGYIIDGDIDFPPDQPIAVPMPEMGVPDFGDFDF
jgi:hypothetical protein